MSRYRLSRSAQRDLVEIRNGIAGRDPAAAADFIDRLITRFERLAVQPLLGRSRDEVRFGLRSSLLGSHLIFYRLISTGIEIVRVVDGRRDLTRIF